MQWFILFLLVFSSPASALFPQPEFSAEEQEWIKNNPTIFFTGDPNWLPYEAFTEDGRYHGMVADYLELIEQNSGLSFVPQPVNSWTESLSKATSGAVDVISGDAADAILNQQFQPVETYSRNPIVIVMDHRHGFVDDLHRLSNSRIAIIKDYGYTADIFAQYPEFDFIEVENIQQGLEGISQGRLDAMLATMALASYHMAELGLYNLRIVGKTPIIMDLTLFISKDKPILHAIINKSLQAIPQQQKQDIYRRWIRSHYVEKTDYTVALIVATSLLLIIALIWYWNRQLKQEIERRLRIEKQLKSGDQLLRAVIDQVPDVFLLKDRNGRFLLCNRAVADLYNTTPQEMVGKIDADFGVPKDLAEKMRENVLDIMEKGETEIVYEDSLDAVNGEINHFRSIKTPMKDPQGQNQILVMSQNVTELVRSRKQLEQSESRYRRLVENLGNEYFFYTHDTQGVFDYVSTSIQSMLGWTVDEFLQHYSLITAEHADNHKVDEYTRLGLSGEKQPPYQVIAKHKDGSKRWLEVSESPLLDENGNVIGLEGIAHDITKRQQIEQALRESEARFRHIFENTDGISVQGYDQSHTVIYWNPASESLYGYTREQAIGRRLEDLIIPDYMRTDVSAGIDAWFAGGPAIPSGELSLLRADHTHVEVFSTHIKLENLQGESEMYCIDIDLTDLRSAQQQVKLLSTAIEQSPVSVVITDAEGCIEYVNPSFETISGFSKDEVVGKNTNLLKSGHTPLSVYHDLWTTIISGNTWQGEMQNRNKQGNLFWEQLHIAPVTDKAGNIQHYLAVKEDITLRKAQEEKIIQQAHYDALTHLPNRFLGLDRLSQLTKEACRNNHKVAVLFIDLDDFKKVNDSLGHDTGDRLLIDAAHRLRLTVREGDTVSRLGGDEFLILFGGLQDSSIVQPIVENMLRQFYQPFQIDGRDLLLTLSVGIALYPDDAETPSELLRKADSAMYHSKEQGRNTYSFYTESMNRRVTERIMIEQQMHIGFEFEEFYLEYQPQYRIHDKSLCAVEALLRWKNRKLGQISPVEFIPVAEQSGMILKLGEYVLDTALLQLAQWNILKPDLRMAINLSPRQFRDPGLVDQIIQRIRSHKIYPQQLELEITEGVLISGHGHIQEALDRLHQHEILLSMDDFGTGYSSLSYLRKYPFDIVKIDRSFIQDIDHDPADRELVGASIAMAHGLGLRVVAEGVENSTHLNYLEELSCDVGQGYYFSKPVNASAIEQILQRTTHHHGD